MTILSFGAGMQSTALALMSCENAKAKQCGKPFPHPVVPIYDCIVFCDLGLEADWVLSQMEFVRQACIDAGIRFEKIDTHLYQDLRDNYGRKRTAAIPFWTKNKEGKEGKISRRACTIDYKIDRVAKFAKWNVLGYRKGQRTRKEDLNAHEMHIGFSVEEQSRIKTVGPCNPIFVKRYPLVELGLDRAANYAYIRDVWGLKTRASACLFCPFHQNFFFHHIKENEPGHYQQLLEIDNILEERPPYYPMQVDLYISRSRKRIRELTPEDCDDAQYFPYCNQCTGKTEMIWNGF